MRTLVSSIGLVLAIPATTFIGALLVRSSRRRADPAGTPGLSELPTKAKDDGEAHLW